MGAVGWRDDEKAMTKVVLGSKAFDYKMSSSISCECSFTAIRIIEDLTNKLSNLVELHDSYNLITWNYATFWQHLRSNSGKLALVWEDWCCREPREDEVSKVTRHLLIRLENDSLQELRKKVLHKFHISNGGWDVDSYALGLYHTTDIDMLFQASMYFSFPRDEWGPGKCFESRKYVWLSDALTCDYYVRSFLTRTASMQTVVLVPTNARVVELGSVKRIPECLGMQIAAVNDKRDGNVPNIPNMVGCCRPEVVPKI